jgi:hypothetical protein
MTLRTWIPKQYGAWAMMLAPIVTSCVIWGFGWQHAVFLVAWITAYLAYMAVRGWLTVRRSPTRARVWVAPMLTYGASCAVAVGGLLVWQPGLTWWAIPLVALLGASVVLVVVGQERSVFNDAFLIGGSCLMVVVVGTSFRATGGGWNGFVEAAGLPSAWLVAAVFAGYFWGTIFYIKTMIRQRGKTGWYLASVVYHLVMVPLGFLVSPWVGALGCLIAARAIAVPKIWPRAKPPVIGAGEVGLTVVMMAVLVAVVGFGG